MTPTNKSATAKETSEKFAAFWSERVDLTARISKRLSEVIRKLKVA